MVIDLESADIQQLLKDRRFSYLLSPVKVLVKKGLPRIEVGSIQIEELKERDLLEMPRWMAEVLSELGFIEIQEESFDIELLRALSREKVQSSSQLSTLRSDFYLRMKNYLNELRSYCEKDSSRRAEFDKISILCRDLITIRVCKLLYNACSSSLPAELLEKIPFEERVLLERVHKIIEDWKKNILEVF
ncbi:MAG: hypothetical protein RMJ31_00845 [Nitrososphaerota archaeon]|nr:hypothetical protein [Nitrososphaerales archaeon]MDW8044311.1 hypothetical protein [Nitrososphaerota archaeon]